MLNAKDIGARITEARRKKTFSQAGLAQQISISPQAVGKWERGESLPDIITLARLAEILGVDLTYFSGNTQPAEAERNNPDEVPEKAEQRADKNQTRPGWDMSALCLTDSDFSGLNNLHKKLSSSNMQRCQFVGSEMSGLILRNNHVNQCDFSQSDLSNSRIDHSMLHKNTFLNCSLRNAEITKSYTEGCDFSGSDFSEAQFKSGGFGKNTMENVKLNGTGFIEMAIQDIVFSGTLEDCRFENCAFQRVSFQNAEILNTFFKNNRKIKQVKLINCRADRLTYAFLKNNRADMSGIILI
ncbi:MAG TPA: pentapeptide repeat-containing protein [Bacteroidales bacterium]|nr:pentapeptide repeat-containing protein [Bacteroidales bacterium]